MYLYIIRTFYLRREDGCYYAQSTDLIVGPQLCWWFVSKVKRPILFPTSLSCLCVHEHFCVSVINYGPALIYCVCINYSP